MDDEDRRDTVSRLREEAGIGDARVRSSNVESISEADFRAEIGAPPRGEAESEEDGGAGE